MVRINYYRDPSQEITADVEAENVGAWLLETFKSRDELLDLRFFKTDLLGEELNTKDVSFLDIDEGTVCVINASSVCEAAAVPYIIVFVASAIVSVVIANNISTSSSVSTSSDVAATSTSSTNSLGDNNNEANVNGRIDDIFGTVNRHMPPLWQYPYRIGVNNVETEVLLLCVGRGKYDIDTNYIYDGDTKYIHIPSSKCSIYEPGSYPGNGTPIQPQLGDDINEPIGIYRLSNDLNAAELTPFNDLDIGDNTVWSILSSEGVGTFTLTNYDDLDVDLQDYFSVEEHLILVDCFTFVTTPFTKTIYRSGGSYEFRQGIATDLSGEYTITSVTENTVTVIGFDFDNNHDRVLNEKYYEVWWTTISPYFVTVDPVITQYTWYHDSDLIHPLTVKTIDLTPDVGLVFGNILGPITIYPGAEKILLNFTSMNGFYKLVDNVKTSVSIVIKITVEELDVDGFPTGEQVVHERTYKSNTRNISSSVYLTIVLPGSYDYARVTAQRLTDRDLSSNVSNVDNCEFSSMYSFTSIPDDHDFGDVTLMHCVIPSNSQSRLTKERKTNLNVTRKITPYIDGELGEVESYATDQFDQIMIHTALDPRIGRLSINEIDADGFVDLRNEMIEYYGDDNMCKFGYDFDSNDYTFQDTFAAIAAVVNCSSYTRNGIYSAFFEKLQSESTMQVTHRNKISGTEVRSTTFRQKYDGVELSYRNNEDGTTETIYIPEDQSAVQPETFELPGCTTKLQAYRYALRKRNKQIYGIHSVAFDMDEYGRMIVPGSRIDSPDSTRFTKREDVEDGYRIYDGEVVEVDGLNVELSQPVEFTEGEDHYIQFTTNEGGLSESILCTATSDDFIVTLSTIPSEALYDGYERDRTKYVFMSEQLKDSVPLIPQTVEFSYSDGVETNTITSINYSDRYYDGDQETL